MAVSKYEPDPRSYFHHAAVDRALHVWGGKDEASASVQVYDSCLELWKEVLTHGPLPPVLDSGASAHSQHYLYVYGGQNCDDLASGGLHRLDTHTSTWIQLAEHSADAPMKKGGSKMIVYENSIIVIGGLGIRNGPIQPGSEWECDDEKDPDAEGYTNEMHKYDLTKGMWSSITPTGARPPPCANFSLTMINNHQAVLFGGEQLWECLNDAYILDLSTMNWSKLPSGDVRPSQRCDHSTVCLGYGGDRPQLLVCGGVDKDNNVLSDVWMMDVQSGKWKQLPVSNFQQRRGHCAAAFTLSPEVTEVVIFGGISTNSMDTDEDISDTNVLTLEKDINDPQAEWVITDVVGITELGKSERIRERITKLSSFNHKVFKSKQESEKICKEAERREQASNSSRREAELSRQQAEKSRQEAEASRQEAEKDRQEAEKREQKAELSRQQAERSRQQAEASRQEAEQSRQTAERRLQEAEKRVQEAETRSQQAEKRSLDAEQARQDAEMRIKEAESSKQEAVRRRQQAERCLVEAERSMAIIVKSKEDEAKNREEAENQLHEIEEQLRVAEQQLQEEKENAQRSAEEVEQAHRRARETEEAMTETNRQLQQMETRAQDSEARLVAEQTYRAREASQSAGENLSQWLVKRREIHMTNEKLGKGGWAKVKVAEFRGMRVAAKQLFKELQSPFYHNAFIREMNMASRCRHPNLVQFIGASMDKEMVILMELMPTSLRQHLTSNAPAIPSTAFRVSVSLDVSMALNYLHLMQPDPIIHRDISCANVLLEPLPNNLWRAKVTDYGSVNLQSQLSTKNPGNPVYSAPESNDQSLQSPKMDIFSFGILLITMCTAAFPVVEKRESLIAGIRERRWVNLIQHCIHRDRNQRPSASQLITELKTWK